MSERSFLEYMRKLLEDSGGTLGKVEGYSHQVSDYYGKPRRNQLKTTRGVWKSSDGHPFSDETPPGWRNNRLKEGINTLIQLYSHFGQTIIHTEGLKTFVDFFCEQILITVPILLRSSELSKTGGSFVQVDSFSCPICYGIFIEPVTIECGHSYCQKCLSKERPGKTCRRCSYTLTSSDILLKKVNILMCSLIEKWWPNYLAAHRVRTEGNRLFDEGQAELALAKYSQAIDLCSDDHLSLGNRAQVLLTLGRSEEALRDAEAAIKSCSVWAKGYFRKSVTLSYLGRYEEAFITLTICLYLVKATKTNDEAAVVPLKTEFMKVLHKIFLQSSQSYSSHALAYRRNSGDPTLFSPYTNSWRNIFTEDDESTSGNEIEKHNPNECRRFYRASSSRLNRRSGRAQTVYTLSLTTNTQNTLRVLRVFDRAVQSAKRIRKQVIERTKTVADQPQESRASSETQRTSVLRPVDHSLVSVNDFECTLCYRLLHQPITTGCGHTFCRACFERCLDHSFACPLCKSNLTEVPGHGKPSLTYFFEIAMQEFFLEETKEREKQHQDELNLGTSGSNQEIEIPIFVCTIGFPTIPCPLHVFEPRYRLMIRRSMETGRRSFGMCSYSPDRQGSFADYGTLLEIKNVKYFADGRSVIDTIGRKRFKVIRRSQKDGYNTARVEIIRDCPVNPIDRSRLIETHDQVFLEANDWLKSINQVLRQRINTHFGCMPSPEDNWIELPDGPSWAWWLLAILPLDTKAQLSMLSISSLQKRLESILKVLTYVKSSKI